MSDEQVTEEVIEPAAEPVEAVTVDQSASPPPPPLPPEFSDFYTELPKLIPSHELQRGVRLLKAGVFVDEEQEPLVFAAYENWTKKQTGEAITIEKAKRRLHGGKEPHVVYVLDGNKVLCGTLLNGGVSEPSRSPIPKYPVPATSALNSFHPRDRMLQQVSGLRSRMTTHEGLVIEAQTKSGKLEFNENFLVQCVNVLRNSKRLTSENPKVRGPIRNSLSVVADILDKAQPVDATGLVPTKYQQDQSVRFLRAKGITFITSPESKLLYCYESKGRGLSTFVRSETAKFGVEAGVRPVPGFDGKSARSQYIGKLWKKGHSYHLHIKAYYSLLRELERNSDSRFRLPKRYSVNDVIFKLSSLFSLALYESELTLLPVLGRYRQTGAKYFRNGDWIFVITDKNVVTSCFKSSTPLPAQPELEKLLKERAQRRRQEGNRGPGNNNPRHGQKPGRGGGGKRGHGRGKGRERDNRPSRSK